MDPLRAGGSLDAAIEGSTRERFLLELFGNSAIFPLANILFEFFVMGGAGYFREHHFYAMVLAGLLQAAILTRFPQRRFAGNLAGPAVYTAIEAVAEGVKFFQAPHHFAYWLFALAIGGLQHLRERICAERARELVTILESIARSSILLAMYIVFEFETAGAAPQKAFFDDPSHGFIAWSIALLGLMAGLAAATSQRYLQMLRRVSRQLRTYSEWFFGPALLRQAVADPASLALARRDRAILFMDVRGFTAWSESQPPETVVSGLGEYYLAAEQVFARHPPIRSKFSADEIMAVYAGAGEALAAARALAIAQARSLDLHGLGAGIGLNWGPVVEGLIGGAAVKQFDVVGDTVNTAKRIEGAAGHGEILASEAFRGAASATSIERRCIEVKGKAEPLTVHRLAA
ncbi:MAG TPA: adenylate/guanylate cyclase domain-containing protein [Usitatibacter sp.]|nr:adenylate/guanylate cyclase domain-containing protein [Usitatibacter sp.]